MISSPVQALLRRRSGRLFAWLAVAAVALVVAAAAWAGGVWVEAQGLAGLRRTAEGAAALRVAVLRNELDKQRALPLVLADDAELKRAIASRDRGALQALDRKLEILAAKAEAADLYVLDAHGEAIAASNWRKPTSFVGSQYGFRPYYLEALRTGDAEQFALGTVSRRPGLYISRRVDGPDGPLGVVVVKLEFDGMERDWRAAGAPAFVVDRQGLALIASEPRWRFHTLGPAPAAVLAALRASRQYGDAALTPLPLEPDGMRERSLVRRTDQGGRMALDSAVPAPIAGWTLHVLTPVAPVQHAAAEVRWIIVLAGGLVAVLAGWIWRRLQLSRARTSEAAASRIALEAAVEARTEELTRANAQLTAEVQERVRTEARLQGLQSELVQANKLASLGQIAAGVAHEINQPVAAIRAYADNSLVLLAKGRGEEAKKNLTVIGELTQRIGSITSGLRAFSRRATGRLEPTSVAEAIEGSLLLTNSRVRSRRLRVVRPAIDPGLRVMAERVRLEQVLVNLLQNAFEALESVERPEVRIAVESEGAEVRITVADNGPGLAQEVAENLFIPFTTTKPRGVGLGLVISRDIVADFGGRLTVESRPGAGAAFTLALTRGP